LSQPKPLSNQGFWRFYQSARPFGQWKSGLSGAEKTAAACPMSTNGCNIAITEARKW
jgi:hypothetical protein